MRGSIHSAGPANPPLPHRRPAGCVPHAQLQICAPGKTAKRGKGGTLASRQALVHSLVHIESWATDLAWDAVARYGLQQEAYRLPREFFEDFVRVSE